MSMNNWRRYKDVLCHPNSEIEKILNSNDRDKDKKAEAIYKKITDDGYARGEFIKPKKEQHDERDPSTVR